MRESEEEDKEGEKDRLATSNSDRDFNNITRNRRIGSTGNITYNITDCADELYRTKYSHVIVIVTENRNFLEILVFGYFGFEWVHTEETNGDDDKLWNETSERLSIFDFISADSS